MRELDVELGHAAGRVRREHEGDGAPAKVDVRVVVHLLGLVGDEADEPDGIREGRCLHGEDEAAPAAAHRPRQVGELAGELFGVEQSWHVPTLPPVPGDVNRVTPGRPRADPITAVAGSDP